MASASAQTPWSYPFWRPEIRIMDTFFVSPEPVPRALFGATFAAFRRFESSSRSDPSLLV